MNKSYRTVWNASTGTWTAAAETARASKKSKSNSTMRSSVTAAVAVMAGVGGVAMSADVSAQTLPTGNGGLALCGPSSGLAYGPGGSVGVGSCNLTTSPYAPGHEMAFQLTNNAAANGGTTGSASDKQYWANIVGTKDGNIFVNGGSGIHFSGAADFDSNVSMTNNRITNLAAGTAGTDAVNVSQLNAAIANVSTTNPYFKVDTASGADAAQAGVGAFAAGANAQGVGQNAAAIGNNASASGMNATAIGISTSATGAASTALGMSAKATQSHATALGVGASAVGVNSIALGVNGTASGMGSVAIGEVARASADGAVALGTGSVADRANSVSVGAANAQRQIVNVAAGTQDSDAVNLGQLNAAVANVSTSGNRFINIATGSYAADAPAVAAGSATAIGANASATGISGVALGGNSVASGSSTVALGTLANATATDATAVGVSARATGNAATAMGRSAQATGNNSTALGNATSAVGAGSIALGNGSVANRGNALSIGNVGAERQIINVAAGTAATDAVNVSQLTGVTAALGGGAAIGTNGSVTQPTYSVDGKDYHNVGDALDALASSGIGNPNAVIYDDATKGSVTLGGTGATTPVALSNVKAGTADTDAVNVSQLKDSGLIGDDGKAIAAVTYDRNADGTPNLGSVTLGGEGSTTPVALKNVADAKDDHDALNLGQLKNAGLVGEDANGDLTSAAVTYDTNADGTINHDKATLAGTDGTTLSNVKAGVADMDAVNVSQLKDSGLIGDDGKAIAAVTYDRNADGTPNLGSVTLGGEGSTTPVALKNVADAKDDHDALNLGQLKNAGLVGEDANGDLTSAAVTYDTNADGTINHDKATLAGTDGTTLSNVKAGVADMDAVNVSQLKDSGLIGDDGKAIAAVTYDRNADGTPNLGSVTLGGEGSTTPVALKNVADAKDDHDALNLGQLKGTGLVGEDANGELTSAAVTYDTNTDGTINHDKATLAGTDGTTLSNVKAGVADMDAVNVSQLKDSGLIGDDGKAIAAVTYDRNADGTPNMGSVTLGGEGSTTPVALSNVKAGTADTDAVNVSQLKDSGLIGDDGKAIAAVTYDRNADGTPNLGSVTLGGEGSTTPVALKNVADAKDDHDALNLGQLKGTGLVGEDANGELTSAAVTYDTNTDGTINHDKATLAGTDGTTLSNVKAGVADMDAVNVSQLKDSGLIGDDGNAIAAVTYDRNADGTPNYNAVTLGGGNASGPVTLSNVAAGVAPTDAVNVQQMQKAVVEGNPYIGGFGANANTLAAQATKINAVALGLGSVANEVNTISVGNGGAGLLRRITNVQNGQADTDVATVGQVNELLGVTSTSTKTAISSIDTKTQSAIMDVNSRLDAINTMMNTTASTDPYVRVDGAGDGSDDAFAGSGTFGVAIGADASASGVTAVAIGPQAVSSGSAAVAIGAGASATSAGAVAFGSSSATGANALSLGNGTVATGNNSIAAGFNTQASGVNSFAMGNTARANAADSIAFGTTAQVDAAATNSIAIGRAANVTSTALNSVALGASSTADRLNSVSVGSSGQQRQIIYVARGTANTDAVNVSQLRDAVSAFGGKAGVGADGSIVNPTYTIDGKTYNNVGDALDALAATSGGGGANPLAVIYDDATKGSVTLGGTGSTTPVALSNVKAGTADTDAVNVSQLKDSGLIGDDGKAIAAVTYDRNADGTPNLGSVTLGGEGSTTPVALKNVADAKDDHDALNLGQLKNAGLVGEDTNGELTSAAVTYDTNTDGTINHDKATLAGTDGTTLSNVKAGVADMDAVNVSQLKDSGLIGDDGKAIAAVTYDRNADGTPNMGSVTLGGEGSTTPVALKNVADAKDDHDALNLGQLKDAGLVGDDGAGNLTSLAVKYDSATKDKVTLEGTNGTTITNLTAGAVNATSMDAVNGSQLYGLADSVASTLGGGTTVGSDGKLANTSFTVNGKGYTTVEQAIQAAATSGATDSFAVRYDMKPDGTIDTDKATLAGTDGTTISNVKAGEVSATSMDAINGSQLHGVSQSVADSLGGGSTVGADGTVTNPTYTLADPTDGSKTVAYDNVGDALSNLDGRTTTNTQNITVINQQLADSGLVDPVTGQSIAAVTYDRNTDGTPNLDKVTLKGTDGTTLSNVKAGVADMDAVNVSQLKDSGLIGDDGKSIAAVTYDDATKGSVTLGGTAATTPVALKNVADAKDDHDALNLGQLKNAGLVGEDANGNLTSAAVTYDTNLDGTINHDKATLAGTDGTTLSNVKAGVADMDAVNVGQLKSAGLIAPVDPTDPGAGLASLAVTYGTNADGTANFDQVKLAGTNGTTITNVKAGEVSATSMDAINGAQLHGVSQSVADSLGGGSTVGTDGTVTNPTYTLADPTDGSKKVAYDNVGDALSNLDGRTTTNTENITVINQQLADSGLVDPVTGQSIAAVTYDRNTDGTPNLGSVTLGGANAAAPVALKNVAAGVDRNDAVNVGQLKDTGLVTQVDPTNPAAGLASLAVTYGKNADGTANFDQVALAGTNGTTITNVHAGAVNATSTDAVNGSQLHGVSSSVAKSLGGGASVDANGNVTNPSYVVNNQTFDNVGDAIENISSSLADGSIGLVQQDETTRDITVAKGTDGTSVNFAGTAGNRVLTGVAAGEVSATSVDAINGSQLHGTAQSVADVIGGGTTVDADGKLADTAIEVNGSKYKTVAEAVQAAAAYGATDSLAVRYDLNGDGTPNFGSVTLGGTGAAPVRLTNVADGTSQYDAVNFGQLSQLSDRIGDIDGRVGVLEQNPGGGGGSSPIGSDYFQATDTGTGTTPANAGTGTGNTAAGSGAVVGTGANNATVVGSNANASMSNGTAIGSGANSSAEGATAIGSGAMASGSNSAAIGNRANASGSNSVALGAGSVATDDNTVSVGSALQQRTISNVADGVNASDAATKGQLDRAMGGMQGQINDLSRNAYSGIAAATALTMIPGVDPGKTISFGVGGATFKGYQAVAFGGEARITQNLKMKAGVGLSSGGNTVGVGASYQW